MFGESIQKQKLFEKWTKNAPHMYNSWKSSFNKNALPFDDWYKLELVNKLPRSKLTITPLISIYHYHSEAHKSFLSIQPDK